MSNWVKEFLKKPVYPVVLLMVVVAVSFLAGSWYYSRKAPGVAGGRKILHYVDPMNPAHTSPEPGLAPCGMKMEPVYADDDGQSPGTSLPPGSVKINSQKQQLIGVRVASVAKTSYTYHLRALGKVAVDERLIYRLNAAVEGWIREAGNNSTGSVVKKDETLAVIYSPEFLAPIQAYLYMLSSLDRFQASGQETPAQLQITRLNVQQYIESLRNLGMSDLQIKEIEQGRQYTERIRIVAPATSFILARNISTGQRFERGLELYRLADLRRVWVLADLFENEAQYIRPGEKVRVTYPYQKKTFTATVSEVLPIFDPTSRTLKVRLEMDNPGYLLRPDMFVDVDFPIKLAPTVNVPVEAVLDCGLKQTVFVDQDKGLFEPRKVETGWRLGDRVQITRGLQPGEKIVVSGNFLIDSESRMRLAATGIFGEVSKDMVCGMSLDADKAKATKHTSEYGGRTYYFCSDECQKKFLQHPQRYIAKPDQEPAQEDQEEAQVLPQTPKEPAEVVESHPGHAAESPVQRSFPNQPSTTDVLGGSRDPVCSMTFSETFGRLVAPKTVYHGTTYYFCSEDCKQAFEKDPEHYLGRHPGTPRAAAPAAPAAMTPGPTVPTPTVVHPGGNLAMPPASPTIPQGTIPSPTMTHPGTGPALPPAMPHGAAQAAPPGGMPAPPPGAIPAAPMDTGIERDIRGRPLRTIPSAPAAGGPSAALQTPPPVAPASPPSPEGHRHD